jgi:SAM-dependent methyltransferase
MRNVRPTKYVLGEYQVAVRDTFFFAAGLVFLLLAKTKNILHGYSSPKPFDVSDAERCVTYDITVVDEWLRHLRRYVGSTDDDFNLNGRDVLELGPGSDLGVGLYLLSKGVHSYSACDVNNLAMAVPDSFYETLFARLRADGKVDSSGLLKGELACTKNGTASRLNYVVRDDFDLASAFGERAFDVVFSQAAFEHFDDIDATVGGLSSVCRPGAVIVAEIDLQTHSRWIRDKDPNNIYRYPHWLYRTFWFRGAPNRLRPVEYVHAFERHGWTDIVIVPLSRLDAQDASGLNEAFRDGSNEMSLLSVVLCARMPAAV